MFSICEKLMSRVCLIVAALFLLHLIWIPPKPVTATLEDDAIGKWADKFGEELWDLAKKMTKSPEIKSKYKEYNARVETKNGEILIKSIVKNVGRMLSRKMDAVKCILKTAEAEAEDFIIGNITAATETYKYYSSKHSKFKGRRALELMETIEKNAPMYLDMDLNPDTHFYNIEVNTSYSSVHLPSNIYDKYPEVLKAIMWSEKLDAVFVNNYKTDPALSWQYFGSDTGILRHYPALQWDINRKTDDADTYDCRKRSWYIETATCSKDIVILLDNSGSMTGFRNHIAKFTIRSVLETFSNNDFFTIFNYSATCDDIIPCFKDALVQATPENIEVFNKAIEKMQPTGYANLSIAYEKAFQLLKKYYIDRRCDLKSNCNQAIMLITDGVAGNTTEIFEKYNWGTGENGTDRMKIRIFTYLLGKEVTKVREIQWMACLNRGYYSHIQTLDEVHEEVLKYVDVIATPLVLQNVDHPPTWTHSFADRTESENKEVKDGKQRLMIAVGVPAFDRTYLTNSTRRARMLGVAGTDVPVEDIDKLTLPYKLGVNGYSFVVSNNGYIIFHPDLRPSHNGVINPNYNSIDLTEVEQLYEDNQPRRPGDRILELRGNMVRGERGQITNVTVKFHYDKMRRVSEEDQDYFYEPLPNTPFSLGLAVPSTYGKTWIRVGEEVKKNIHMGINISDFFVGENWKIHPDWVYCKYHYLEGHEFKTPEEEFRHFLSKMVQKDWTWSEQYEKDASDEDDDQEPNCGRITLNDDAYYCNKELVQLLIFEAKVTNSSYGEWKFKDEEEKNLIERYNASLRYVATMSGLTRWQFIFGEVEVDTDFEFGDYHTKAIDETWYRSAILQHRIDPDSFVYSVPHREDEHENAEIQVTASHAIFPRDGGMEAPACVVGFQFPHSKMWERFANITSEENCNGCVKTCVSEEHECYVLDNNGYILISQNNNHTGLFFGEVEGAVMEAMVERDIFKAIEVYDYQALCLEVKKLSSDAHSLLHPIRLLSLGWKWLVTAIFWHWSRIQMWAEGMPFYDDEENDSVDYENYIGPRKTPKAPDSEEDEKIFPDPPPEPTYDHCDMRSTLFTLQESNLQFNNYLQGNNSRPFHLKRIPKSNLILLVVKVMFPTQAKTLSTQPQRIEYDLDFPCYKLNMSFLERHRLEECFTEHPNETEFTYCGDAASIGLSYINLVAGFVVLVGMRYLQVLVD